VKNKKKASGYSETTLCHCITHKGIGDVSTELVWVVVRSVIHVANVSNKTFSNCRVMVARKEISFISPSQIYFKFNVKNVCLCRVLLVQLLYKRWFKIYVIGKI
jgi:hypothetical protein